ncbi:peptidase [Clostridiaceae bacterium AF02-42]|uniref:S8 family peptidase n=1 Tax=Clostridium sp. AF28-12 TaxID=2305241 RepID=UPI000E3F5526|nr:S8 family peptidase [Clostridium sp. AF28-12]RGD97610.1 peptidase [Clostridium sp. AF28-12]RGD99743.1 peptidase [Clostridiaceae bacterium AF02-42]
MSCTNSVASEDFADFIAPYFTTPEEFIRSQGTDCIDFVNSTLAVVYVPLSTVTPSTYTSYTYSAVPKLYSLLDVTSMDAAGITAAGELPVLNNQGAGVIVGFVDTGINYTDSLFRNVDGSTRIIGIWDQTNNSDNSNNIENETAKPFSAFSALYGTQYTAEEINLALNSDNPASIVPTRDENGHGTFLASIAAGNRDERAGFSGAASQASIAMVKLKPAKQYLRDFYLIQDGADAYQENDIMMGVSYLYFLARKYSMPLVVCIPLGTNMGSHMGMSRLGQYLNQVSLSNGSAVITAAGNETGARHHFRAVMDADTDEVTAELRVGEREAGFSMELWAENMGAYTVGFISPTGEVAREISVPLRGENTVFFLLEQTQITVYTQIADVSSGSQFIFMRFENPMSGIWRILIRNSLDIRETFHIWLPVRGFISDETYFLRPDPDTIITDPGNARYPITVTAYDHTKNSIYIHASRGYSLSGRIKPDLAAPGVNILGASVSGRRLTRMSGTSVSAAHLAGAAAILLNWGVLNANYPYLNTPVLKSIFVRGAQRNPALTYPNREFGYGTLNLYEAFLHLRNL